MKREMNSMRSRFKWKIINKMKMKNKKITSTPKNQSSPQFKISAKLKGKWLRQQTMMSSQPMPGRRWRASKSHRGRLTSLINSLEPSYSSNQTILQKHWWARAARESKNQKGKQSINPSPFQSLTLPPARKWTQSRKYHPHKLTKKKRNAMRSSEKLVSSLKWLSRAAAIGE